MTLTAVTPAFLERRLTNDAPLLILPQTAQDGRGKHLHVHPEGQLYLALQGLIVVEAGDVRTVLPPGHIGWIPPGLRHGASAHSQHATGSLVGLTIYLAPALCQTLPAISQAWRMTPLIDAVLDRLRELPPHTSLDARHVRLLDVLLDELAHTPAEALRLVMPRHPRLLQMAAAIAHDPADGRSLDAWADALGLSRRSVTRHFREETGMSLIAWRQLARLQRGMELLHAGEAVTTVALTLGYDSVSSFIALFRRVLGTTPARFAGR
ncbi:MULTISPECIES: AraC family transcriptional regulator [unclassified Janthinobacterium]|uniref:helix-turn-helix transcriptional regulator n=1 Tax=unclassified Janthinobacterium TaxID=2610881 RepID=UPI00160F184A|nr:MULTISPECIES: AraC family transcriptional regulator [unclassified Janthinobacterium]MBB5369192.1 AraC-like DNA-binding protein [Janthinobacterium sp. K2C7]MBB5381271.1 AraC-like DNA-binding protein [Janthinobacterium sp. K2Li3]MBB5387575.1 AraC-like DNA-binding protein [Janthinobacterium sp. K2E3]